MTTTSTPEPMAPVDTSDIFLEFRFNRGRWLIGALAAGVVVLILGMIFVVRLAFFQPEDAIKEYFDALADRDAVAAARATVDGAEDGLDAELLTSGDYQPPSDVDVEQIDRGDGEATARVRYTVDGNPFTVTLTIRQDTRATLGIFRGWRVDGGRYPLNLGDAPPSVTVNGRPLPTIGEGDVEGGGGGRLALFLGGHLIGMPDQPLLEAAPVRVYGGAGDPVNLAVRVKESVTAEVDTQVRAYLDRCAAQSTLEPAGCPFQVSTFSEVVDVKWRIVEYPRYTLVLSTRSGEPVQTVGVDTTTPGFAEVTGTYQSSSSEYQSSDRFELGGTVVVTDGKPTYRPPATR